MTLDAGNLIRVVVCRPANSDVTSVLIRHGFKVLEAKSITECLEAFKKERCHLIIIDYEIIKGEFDVTSGSVFELILRSLCSAPCFVLCGSPVPVSIVESMSDCGFFPISIKRNIETLPSKIRKIMDKDRAIGLEIKWSEEDEKTTNLSLDKHEIHWVMSHLLPKAHKLFVDETSRRKNSIVLRGRIDNLSQPLLLKVGRADRVKREVANYSEFIHWRLANTSYAFMENSRCWSYLDLGGILYTFLGSKNYAETFSRFYTHQTIEVIIGVLNVLFETLHKGLYGEPTLLPNNLYEAYDSYLNLTKILNNPLPDVEFGLLDPRQWVLANKEKSNLQKERLLLYQARTHGDLWGENILIEKFGDSRTNYPNSDEFQTWLIDFERAGWGHAHRDFVELEVDILTRLGKFAPKDSLDFYELAVSLTKSKRVVESTVNPVKELDYWIRYWTELVENNLEAQKAFRAIQEVRASLTKIWGLRFTDAREYYWGLLLDSLYVALNTGLDIQQRKHAATYASILAGRLQNWESEKWPPDGWKKVEFKDRTDDSEKPAKSPTQKEHMV